MLTDDQLRDFAPCLARATDDGVECEVVYPPLTRTLVIESPESITRVNHPTHARSLEALLARVARRVDEGWLLVPAPLRFRNSDGAERALWLPVERWVRVDRDEPACVRGEDEEAAIGAYNDALAGLLAEGFERVLAAVDGASERLTEGVSLEVRSASEERSESLCANGVRFGTTRVYRGGGALVGLAASLEGRAHGIAGGFEEGKLVRLARYDRW